MESSASAVMALCFLLSRGTCSEDAAAAFSALTGLPPELLQRITQAPDSHAAFAAAERSGQFSGESGRRMHLTPSGSLRLEAPVMIEKNPALAVLELSGKDSQIHAAETGRGMPVLAFLSCGSEGEVRGAETLTARICGSAQSFNPMCALSLEDAARLERVQTVNDPSGERLPKGLFPPGAAGVLSLEGGTASARAAAAERILCRAAVILLRRLDIARAYAAEGGVPGGSSG